MNTYADDLAELLEALDLRGVTMVGHSTGGGEVTRYIGRHGTGRVAGAVLIGAVPPSLVKSPSNPDGIPVEVFVSGQLHPKKRARIEALGARLRVLEGDALAAELAATREAAESGRPNVSPYNDFDVIEGQGTVAVEVLHQLPATGHARLDAVFVAVGGGGLVGGMGHHLAAHSPETQVVGCWPANSDAR